ncbi:MAG TPA: helix-turn-helix domain-containing protein [Polyangiaceae bacterium]|nr:helix-turn-helix domain-containing protein [Polyangiaceae bacterium]
MQRWQLAGDPKTDGVLHRVTPGFGHALLAPMVAHNFETLQVSAAVWEHGVYWMPIHTQATAHAFEQEQGKEQERFRYNERMFARVLREKRQLRGEHAGLSDLFTPILSGRDVIAVLVCGPFLLERPTSASLLDRFRWLTGGSGHPTDPRFAAYLAEMLDLLVLEGEQGENFERLVACLGKLMAGEGRADELANRAEALRAKLEKARFVERMWDSARTMLDDRFAHTWQTVAFEKSRRLLGLSKTPEDVLVGLSVSSGTPVDAVEEALRRDAFQRAAAHLARKWGDLIAGRVGDRGVVFLSSAGGSKKKRSHGLLELTDRAAILARKHGLSLACGLNLAAPSTSVSLTYQAALSAAEDALANGKRLVTADSETQRSFPSLRRLRQDLGQVAERNPERLATRFDRYLEAVAAQCGRRIDSVRGHLDAGFERIAEPLLKSGVLDPRSLERLSDVLDRSANEASAVDDLFAAYRRAVVDASDARQRPVPARRDRSLRAAIEHIHRHYAESLPLSRVARVAGFNEDHFSKLFKQREGKTFERYLRDVRLERAKRLLSETDLGVARIAELTGFHSAQYFCRVFRQSTGRTPIEQRKARVFAQKRQRQAD